ncbi:S9 family peptidase [Yaniella flava]|uniref:S9 family peptidase n=1 Tax=Yaniella flava TaxID=287930 RepID=A0ABN2ULW5_9MICC
MTSTPPQATRKPVTATYHGVDLVDSWDWLKDPQDPNTIAHLEAENAYTETVTADQQLLRDAIFAEIKSHTVETDMSVPSRINDWWYFTRTSEGAQYGVHCRVPVEGDSWEPPQIQPGVVLAGEQVLLDGNVEAEKVAFFSLGAMTVSPDGTLLAYLVDETGDERFTLRLRDLTTGEQLPDEIPGLSYGVAFDPAGERVFYMEPDASWRPYKLKSHRIGTPVSDDVLLHGEADPQMWSGFGLSPDKTKLLFELGNSEVTETHIMDLTDPAASLQLLISRDERSLHDVLPVGDRYLITHNRAADGTALPNNEVAIVDAGDIGNRAAWQTVFAHSPTVKLDGVGVTRQYLFAAVRAESTPRMWVVPLEGLGTAAQADAVEPGFAEELYSAFPVGQHYDSPYIRLAYTSWITPAQILDYDPVSNASTLRRATEVPGYDPEQYLVERWWAPAESTDRRVAIPLTVIRHKDIEWDGNNPALIHGYGSYEASMDPGFGPSRLSLLDRGVVFVVAHVRGGGELGRAWYEDGKKLAKKNSFTDFVDATRFVAASGWVHPDRIAAMGGSAGGLLMGGVLNVAPELYRVCLAQVPFVDALTSILDPDLPLTALEWEEWGNPIEEKSVFDYMLEYTPYHNVATTDYPAVAAVTSLHDTRVLYVEPAKWVQELRATVTSDQSTPLAEGGSPVVLKTEMEGGHGGASGRYRAWEDRAWDYAFILTALNAQDPIYQ